LQKVAISLKMVDSIKRWRAKQKTALVVVNCPGFTGG
jgi:hypothetical protein